MLLYYAPLLGCPRKLRQKVRISGLFHPKRCSFYNWFLLNPQLVADLMGSFRMVHMSSVAHLFLLRSAQSSNKQVITWFLIPVANVNRLIRWDPRLPKKNYHVIILVVSSTGKGGQPKIKVIWMFPKIGVPQNGWFITENPIKMDDLGVNPPFSETSI